MILSCSENEFRQYIDYAYELASDLTKSGYPTYCDGIKTKEMFVERSLKAFERDNEQMLFFIHEGAVAGLIHYYWLPEDRYLSTVSFNIGSAPEKALDEFLAFLGERFPGYDVFLGFPSENEAAVNYLAAHGFECIENDWNNTAYLDRIDPPEPDSCMIRISADNYESFRTVHRQIEGGMYWNSDRILADLEEWSIFVREKDGIPQGAVYYTDAGDGWYEIFGIDIDQGKYDPRLFRELLQAALSDAKRRDGRVMTFFCEEEYEETAKECGFFCVGNYLCYRTHL